MDDSLLKSKSQTYVFQVFINYDYTSDFIAYIYYDVVHTDFLRRFPAGSNDGRQTHRKFTRLRETVIKIKKLIKTKPDL